MKVKTTFALILSVLILGSTAHAVETMNVEPAMASAKSSSADIFGAVVTGDGQLVLNPGPVFTEGGDYEGTEMPYLVSHPKSIKYPRWALRQGWQGEFAIAIEILTNGKVGRYKVMKSTGYEILDEAATEAVKGWTFHPAMKNGKAVLTCIQIPVRFQIDQKA